MNPSNLEEQQKVFNIQVKEANEKLKSTHNKKEYTLSTSEKRRLAQQDLIEKFASQALEDIINLNVLPRIGITPNQQVFTLYDITLGKLTVFTPKPKTESTQQ